MKPIPLSELDTLAPTTGEVNIIIETPRGCRNKLKYDAERGLFLLHKVLPAGAVFPYDFGFFPSTAGEDGDPLDALVLMDEPAFPGVLVQARLIGCIEAEQKEKTSTFRNDRLIAVASVCHAWSEIRELSDLNTNLVNQIEHFFISYNETEGREFKPLGRGNAKKAQQLLDVGQEQFGKKHKRRAS